MQEPYWWYVLFVRSNTENRVVTDVMHFFGAGRFCAELEAFYLESEYYYRNQRAQVLGRTYLKRPILPGYVFIETTMPAEEFLRNFSNFFYNSHDIIRVLNSGEDEIPALPTDERVRLEYLYRGKRCLEHSIGYKEGDLVRIIDGPLLGREGEIIHINRHNREALLKIEVFGQSMAIKVALEIIDSKNRRG